MYAFAENWLDDNGDPWNATRWTTSASAGGTVDVQSNRGRLTTGSQGGYLGYARAVGPTIPRDADIRVTFNITSGIEMYCGVGIRTDGVFKSSGDVHQTENGIFIEIDPESDILQPASIVGGVRTLYTSDNGPANGTTGIAWMRILAVGPSIRAKFWRDTEAEPGGWRVAFTDWTNLSNRTLVVGLLGGNPASAHTIDIDDIAVREIRGGQL